MTVAEILERIKALSPAERAELTRQMETLADSNQHQHQPKTGADIVAMLEALDEPIEMVDPHIEDPVEWVKAQRQKRLDKLKPYWDGDA